MGRLACPAAIAVALVFAASPARPGDFELPADGSCQPGGGLRSLPGAEDVGTVPLRPGDVYTLERLGSLRFHLPAAIYEQREKFFFEGMRLVIGPCFRDYGPPSFFREATAKFRGQARLRPDGGLEGYTAGEPFAREDLSADDPAVATKWAWNVAMRYQGAGFRGRFRITDLVGRTGRAEPFEGEIFKILTAHRADLAETGYRVADARDTWWVAGGIFLEPFAAREFSWRQYRSLEVLASSDRSDDLHAYLPEWRRVRRLNASRVEGLFLPSFSVGVQPSQQLAVGSGDPSAGAGGVASAGGPAAVGGQITPKRSGFEGLELRPNLYEFRLLGLHDVLAPINVTKPLYPTEPDRDFGPWGLSFADDTWDLRRAIVLEGRGRSPAGGEQVARFVAYYDLQTLVPLYYMAYDSRDELTDIGVFAGRWSEDREDYPRWPDDPARPVRVIDSVGEAFANLSESGSWRRESDQLVATPPPDRKLRALLSVSGLTRRR